MSMPQMVTRETTFFPTRSGDTDNPAHLFSVCGNVPTHTAAEILGCILGVINELAIGDTAEDNVHAIRYLAEMGRALAESIEGAHLDANASAQREKLS